MKITLNLEQKKSLSNFFNSIAVAWFAILFAAPFTDKINSLIFIQYFVNMFVALYISVHLLKEQNEQ